MRKISVGHGLFTIIDDEDYEKVIGHRYKWYVVSWKRINRHIISSVPAPNTETIQLHRFIMDAPQHLLVDHINHDGLDNRKSNLRLCTKSQNCQNRRLRQNTKSKYKGVCEHHSGNHLWQVRIRVNGKRISLGYFESEVDAAMAYDRGALLYHKEFALLNFPEIDYANTPFNPKRTERKRNYLGCFIPTFGVGGE